MPIERQDLCARSYTPPFNNPCIPLLVQACPLVYWWRPTAGGAGNGRWRPKHVGGAAGSVSSPQGKEGGEPRCHEPRFTSGTLRGQCLSPSCSHARVRGVMCMSKSVSVSGVHVCVCTRGGTLPRPLINFLAN
ncbi:hypothetical protein E2C01_016172 [Portunus trituberculatus]|uniref:Uncharacterized protein n=1 Tax=Portunus trituberculatus TaxID=210409 RepID=A0A5B7DQ92_PORTR|nr:hypothetical protein [Portunus trituberculatus]